MVKTRGLAHRIRSRRIDQMARVTVEDCLENVDNRFELVMVSSKRARQIAMLGKEPMVLTRYPVERRVGIASFDKSDPWTRW